MNFLADAIIVRHRNMDVIRALARYSAVPIINAMTDRNHPCEIISDMYSLSKMREEFIKDKYLSAVNPATLVFHGRRRRAF